MPGELLQAIDQARQVIVRFIVPVAGDHDVFCRISLSRSRADDTADLTVPSAQPITSAVWRRLISRRYRQAIASCCRGGSRSIAARSCRRSSGPRSSSRPVARYPQSIAWHPPGSSDTMLRGHFRRWCSRTTLIQDATQPGDRVRTAVPLASPCVGPQQRLLRGLGRRRPAAARAPGRDGTTRPGRPTPTHRTCRGRPPMPGPSVR